MDDLADAAGVSPRTVYTAMRNEEFRLMFVEALRGNLHADLPQVIDAYIQEAKEGSHQHGKTLMEITGLYDPKKRIDADLRVSTTDVPFNSKEEMEDFARETMERWAEVEEEEEDA